MKVLLTGEKGFVGSNLLKRLRLENFSVTTNENEENIDAICHQAAITRTFGVKKNEIFESNVHWPLKLFEKLAKKGCKKYVIASSTAIYGNQKAPYNETTTNPDPLNFYAESKLVLEQKTLKMGLNATFLRYCNVYGPNEKHKKNMASMVFQLLNAILQGKKPKLFEFGEQKREWIHVLDACKANVCALNYQNPNTFNCGTGNPITFNQLIHYFNMIFGKKIAVEYIKNPFTHQYQSNVYCDMKKAKEFLKFEPKISLFDGLQLYVDFLIKNY